MQNMRWQVISVHVPSPWQLTVNTDSPVLGETLTRLWDSWQSYFPLKTSNMARINAPCVNTRTQAIGGGSNELQSSKALLGMVVSRLWSMAMLLHTVTKNSFALA